MFTTLETPAHAPQSAAALHLLLTQGAVFAAVYDDGMANHLPMTLHAASALGAGAERLQAQWDHDAPRLEPLHALSAAGGLTDATWRQALGRRDQEADLRAYFLRALQEQGLEAVLRAAVPTLMVGWHAHAFHGLIRLGHAVEGGTPLELGAALAAWASEWERLAEPQVPAKDLWGLDAWMAQWLPELPSWTSAAPLIQLRMREAQPTAIYQRWADALAPQSSVPALRDRLIEAACGLYLQSRNFTVLHMITALRALRVVQAWVPDTPQVQRAIGRGALAAALAARWPLPGRGVPEALREATVPEWPQLRALALAQWDEHVIKLVHACDQEDHLRPRPHWRMAAALALGCFDGARG
ncbi:questin oxidase family protein [Inhella gelatinilytica]|uniref:Questin oxidase family protein n=1 Tax=Inhella gelatinilytica TaxID=2795030 RepID=A0A931NDF5_9BURK|nr:questin oxidase family protein [Inhella gelatinilytica]MBH9552544.1 questin oxidase family protein [Inhella gelatinilytica]